MKVFISWSGQKSLGVAQILREWLPCVIQSIEPYVSSEDIDKGARWSTDIATELESSSFGILCVTKENLTAPWLSFEAGALSKSIKKSFVTPFLFDIKRSEVNGPILQFQSTVFEKEDIHKMIKTLNSCGGSSISDTRLDDTFDVWYSKLEKDLNSLKESIEESVENEDQTEDISSHQILEEILELSRDNQRLIKMPDDKLDDLVSKVDSVLKNVLLLDEASYVIRKRNKRYYSRFFEEIVFSNRMNHYGFLFLLSLFKDDFPWIYDIGREAFDIVKNTEDTNEKKKALSEFKQVIELTCENIMMRDMRLVCGDIGVKYLSELPFYLERSFCDDECIV